MVRFHWHVEDGLSAYVGPGQLVYLRDSGVMQATVDIEMGDQGPDIEAVLTIPQNYNTDSGVKELGLILAHGADASEWRGRLMSDLAVSLARAGYFVVRPICADPSEARRAAAFEKVADAAATCPYARGVTRWVLAGMDAGGRAAALAGARLRAVVAGFVLLSYPLREEMPAPDPADVPAGPHPAAYGPAPDSSAPLLPLRAPLLFVSGSCDPLVSEGGLMELAPRLATCDLRSVVIQDVDATFRSPSGKGPHATTLRQVNAVLQDFLNAAGAWRMDGCKLPQLWRGGGGGPPGGVGLPDGAEGRPPLRRPACFRPIPSAPPPPPAQPPSLAPAQPYGALGAAAAAQLLAAQMQQRQAGGGAHAAGAAAAAALLAQQQQHAAAAAAAALAAAQPGLGLGGMSSAALVAAATQKLAALVRANSGSGATSAQLAVLAQALQDPNTAAQVAAAILRTTAVQPQAVQPQLAVQHMPAAQAVPVLQLQPAVAAPPQPHPQAPRLQLQLDGSATASGGTLPSPSLLQPGQMSGPVLQLQAGGAGALGGQQQQQQLQLQQMLLQQQQQRQGQPGQAPALNLGLDLTQPAMAASPPLALQAPPHGVGAAAGLAAAMQQAEQYAVPAAAADGGMAEQGGTAPGVLHLGLPPPTPLAGAGAAQLGQDVAMTEAGPA